MNVDHALVAGGSDDHEAVALVGRKSRMHLGQCREEHRRLVLEPNEVRLFLLRVVGIFDPFVPTVCHHQRSPIRPELLEELAGGDGLDSGVDRVRAFALGPEGRPAPVHRINP
nr:hypothetical protein [Pseudomonas fuscovaginae]